MAVDGVDASDILLVDSIGCPTDINIIGFVNKVEKSGKRYLEVPFEAFKFPTSDMVQFRALVTPCLTGCEPVTCAAQGQDGKLQQKDSYGKRRRRRSIAKEEPVVDDNELVMTQAIRITDSFGFKDKNRVSDPLQRLFDEEFASSSSSSFPASDPLEPTLRQYNQCLNMTSMTIACVVFLLIQIVMIIVWAFCWSRKTRQQLHSDKASFIQYPFSGVMKGETAASSLRFTPTFAPCRRD